mmetsp:Transcript_123776/g.214580  ORF Transcript_123776/g.214580 Transcript_123776/m.214580 type:complete len:215 (+) Transcript_123776:42-686(+)
MELSLVEEDGSSETGREASGAICKLEQEHPQEMEAWSAAEAPRSVQPISVQPKQDEPVGSDPSAESIVAWLTSTIYVREELVMAEPGRLFYWGIPRNVDAHIRDMMQPVFSHINRDDHCERYGFLHTVRAIVRRCGLDATDECSGRVSLYVSHFPCISCIAVFCQFIRFFPSVRLEVDFDNMWRTRFRQGRQECRPDAWKVWDVQEGKVEDLTY